MAGGHKVSARTCRFAKWPAICSFALVMAGQVAYHLMAQAELARAPWADHCRRVQLAESLGLGADLGRGPGTTFMTVPTSPPV